MACDPRPLLKTATATSAVRSAAAAPEGVAFPRLQDVASYDPSSVSAPVKAAKHAGE